MVGNTAICYQGIQRAFRNTIVGFLREHFPRIFPKDHVQQMKKLFGDAWDKAATDASPLSRHRRNFNVTSRRVRSTGRSIISTKSSISTSAGCSRFRADIQRSEQGPSNPSSSATLSPSKTDCAMACGRVVAPGSPGRLSRMYLSSYLHELRYMGPNPRGIRIVKERVTGGSQNVDPTA
jgi:hypothetical protein